MALVRNIINKYGWTLIEFLLNDQTHFFAVPRRIRHVPNENGEHGHARGFAAV